MCMFNDPVEDVRATKLFALPLTSENGKNYQLTAYSNKVKMVPKAQDNLLIRNPAPVKPSGIMRWDENYKWELRIAQVQKEIDNIISPGGKKHHNAMILPFPIFEQDSLTFEEYFEPINNKDVIQLVDLKEWENKNGKLFISLDAPFVERTRSSNGGSRGGVLKRKLGVTVVGDYNCSVARSLKHLEHVDTDVFKVSDTLLPVLKKHYPVGYGFLICSFAKNVNIDNSHPIAYVHERFSEGLFIPCRHEHGDNSSEGVAESTNSATYDHCIYYVGATLNHTRPSDCTIQDVLGYSFLSLINKEMTEKYFYTDDLLHKIVLVGKGENTDIIIGDNNIRGQ